MSEMPFEAMSRQRRDGEGAVATSLTGGRWYNAVWRWHFYAGLFCIPFVIWLSITGAIYLWRPQIESWLDRPYDHLAVDGPIAAADAQVAAALSAVPGSTFRRYVVPQQSGEAARVIVGAGGDTKRVYLDPRSLKVLDVVSDEQRPMRVLFRLHGELLAGAPGSYLVETAACWAIVMILTGLYLWWPRGRTGLAGVLYPRIHGGSRTLWRDIHATAGIWVSVFALILILTGLPWAKGWGTYLKQVRDLTGTSRGVVDWTIGGQPPKQDEMLGDHSDHDHAAARTVINPGELDRVIVAVAPLGIAPPVLISPPKRAGATWTVVSDAANRPLRTDIKVDGTTGSLLSRVDFSQRHWIDQAVGYGVAVHEGMLFGLANQIIGTLTALFLVVLAVSGAIMWWRRRPVGLLGAPIPRGKPRFGVGLVTAIFALGVYMPLFGLTLIAVLFVERQLLARLPATRAWLNLRPA